MPGKPPSIGRVGRAFDPCWVCLYIGFALIILAPFVFLIPG